MKSGNRTRAEKRRASSINSPETEPAVEADEHYLARHPTRCFWVRSLGQADKQFIEHASSKLELPAAGMKWFVAVWQMMPDYRMKVIFQAPISLNTDASEEICQRLYFELISPEKIALSSNLEILSQFSGDETTRDGEKS
jgi:hypothetical protein